ncbi:hypothetical protein ACOMHN_023402 [Nucella lapillus]
MEGKLHQTSVEESYPEPHSSHLTPLSAPTTTTMLDMAAYNQTANPAVTSSFPLDLHPPAQQPPHYYSDFDWQHGVTAVPDPGHGSFYGFAERPDLASVQLYHGFPGGMPPHTDLYTSSPALWHHPSSSLVEDPGHSNALTSQRYLPSLTRASAASSASPCSSSSSTTSNPSSGSTKPKRRRVQSVPQRKAANVRERRRMFHLNSAFDELRKRLPAFNYEKRLSRIETLRLAMTYIGFMKDVTTGQDPRKVKLRPSSSSDAASDLSHIDMESCTSEDARHEDVDS